MRTALTALLAAAALAAPASASELERVPALRDPATAKECGECHMPFQPALLPGPSWMWIIDGLHNHFGDDASLPADVEAGIRAHLAANAGRTGDPGLSRITQQHWFLREHRFGPQVWQRPEVGTVSNCPACHRRAGQGIYDD